MALKLVRVLAGVMAFAIRVLYCKYCTFERRFLLVRVSLALNRTNKNDRLSTYRNRIYHDTKITVAINNQLQQMVGNYVKEIGIQLNLCYNKFE